MKETLNWTQEDHFYVSVVYGVYRVDSSGSPNQYSATIIVMGETGTTVPTMIGIYDTVEEAKLACEKDYIDRSKLI
jgi:hypothetical protein